MTQTAPPPITRKQLLAQLDSTWDVIVIGGGATGLGTAIDAAARGYRTLLIEAADFAKGSSSKATKLVHGGVRYLAQGNIKLVREALHERRLLLRNAPHLVRPLGFIVPAYTALEKPFYGIGLKLYDLLAGKKNLTPSRYLSRTTTQTYAPTLAEQLNGRALKGGVLYYDAQFDDARLAISLMRTLLDLGGTAVNYVRATGLLLDNGKINGIRATDVLNDSELTLRARCVINATGVWVDALRQLEAPQSPALVTPSQGVHLTLPRKFLPGQHALLIPKTADGRVLFLVPWNGHTLIGTTDTPRTDLPLDPQASAQDIDFILHTAARYLKHTPTRDDITSAWAGLRPLVNPAGKTLTRSLSREHTIVVSPAGLITVTGGKWTTYRKMAEDVIDTAIAQHLLRAAPCRTETLMLHGAQGLAPGQKHLGTPNSYYGNELALLQTLPGHEHMLVAASGLSEAHVRYAARYELACSAEDVLARRNRALFLDRDAALYAAPEVARILAQELGHDAAWQTQTLRALDQVAASYRLP